ncbi:ABC transporter substrate-binding protein [Psychromonas aquimarina]|uniref:ABC transporter substrate-binding protein n=1 Tax=Psychromonas aquimarina TaxID=444919 RepID=UPI00048BBC9D|nr:ABC transporter substrate-binding protein [Psychromonas aquimarina]
MKNKHYFLILCCFLLPSVISSGASMKVTFINPGVSVENNQTGSFWYNVSAFMKAAANDLDIDLEVLYAERNHLNLDRLMEKVKSREQKPDYLIIVNEKNRGTAQLEIAMAAGIKTFMMLNALTKSEEIEKMGVPRGKHANWIGSLVPDNYYAGYQVAKTLIDKALQSDKTASDGKLHILGYAGDFVTPAAVLRNKGLKAAVSEYPNVELKQLLVAHWSKEKAYHKTIAIFARYPELSVIWAANDPIALGSLNALVKLGKSPGKEVFVGGVNWDPEALQAIKENKLSISMGGHFMTGGWVLVLLYDYHNGKDFVEEGAVLDMKIFDPLDSKNIDQYLQKFASQQWDKIDFRKFSKVLNPNIIKYNFSASALLEQAQ